MAILGMFSMVPSVQGELVGARCNLPSLVVAHKAHLHDPVWVIESQALQDFKEVVAQLLLCGKGAGRAWIRQGRKR